MSRSGGAPKTGQKGIRKGVKKRGQVRFWLLWANSFILYNSLPIWLSDLILGLSQIS
jgi:hypothetical protein